MTSVNYNASATSALRTLQATNSQLDAVQNRISTGLKIESAKDNAAYWSISTTLKSDNKSLATVKDALGLGTATVDVAYQGLNKAKDVLDEIKSKLTAATTEGVDRETIQKEISQLQQQLKSIASSSVFSGENWLSIDSAAASFNPEKQVVSSFSRDANGAVSIGTIGVNTKEVALFDAANGGSGILDKAGSLKDSAGRDLAYGGTSLSGNTETGGIAATNVAGTDSTKAKSVFTGTFTASNIDRNDSITLSYRVDGQSTPTDITIDADNVKGSGFATAGRISSVDELATAVNNALREAGKSDVVAINDGGKLALQRSEAGAARSVQVTAWTGTDADFVAAFGGSGSGVIRSTLGALGTSAAGESHRGAQFEVQTLTGFTATGTPDATDAISLVIGGGANGRSDTTITIGAGGTLGAVDLTGKNANQIAELIRDTINNDTRVNGWVSATIGTAGTVTIAYKEAGNFATVTYDGNAAGAGGAFGTTGTASTVRTSADPVVKARAGGDLTAGTTVFGDDDDAVTLKFTDSLVGTATEVKITNADLATANITDRTLDSDADWAAATKAAFDRMGLSSKYDVTGAAGKLFITAKTATQGQTIQFDATTPISASDADTAVQKKLGLAYSSDVSRGVDGKAASSVATTKLPVGGITLDADDKIYFNVAADGSKASQLVTVDQATVNSALKNANQAEVRLGNFSAVGLSSSDTISLSIDWNGTGARSYTLTGLSERSTAEEFAAKLNQASGFSSAGVASVENGRIVLRTNNVGSAASVEVTAVSNSNANANSGGLAVTTKHTGSAANANAQGKITTASDLARVVQAAMDKAGVTGVLAGVKDDALTFESTTVGAKSAVSISQVQGTSGANTISVDTINIASESFKALSSDQAKQVLSAYIDVVNKAITNVTAAAANLGSVSSRIEMQSSFVDTMIDTIDKGVSALIDADMTEESTKLQALQVKQQLGVQALSIANQSAQSVLSLFRG